jgi:predicted Zn-dependent protease
MALIPAEPGSAAVVEERSACRLADLDPRDCLREALQRTKPARRPEEEATAGRAAPLLLTPRASASFLAAIAPCALSGEAGLWKGSVLRIVDDPTMDGRPGSAPFDGAGYDTRRTVLMEDGSAIGRLSAEGGNLIRPSYRDLPVVGAAGLLILPADGPSGADDRSPAPSSDDTLTLQVSAIEVIPGPVCTVRIRRGDWWSGGTSLGPADGLSWEGPLTVLLRGVSAVGKEVKFYHCDAPLGTPSLRIDGLTPLRVEAPGRSAVRV